jgi:pimeloyl-ACP methyl ester carboxylesterase
VLDLPGLGDSGWRADTDFTFTGQARRVAALLAKLEIDRCALLAHDTGGTVARLATLAEPARVAKLAILNTEIPGHRPPWIPLYQKLTRVPGSAAVFRVLLRQDWFVRSGMGFGPFYTDRRRFDDPAWLAPYLDPVLASPERMRGMLLYLQGPEWDAVDALRTRHGEIRCPALLVWGEDDVTFPAARAEAMTAQFGGPARFVRIPRASLMPHEEQPDAVLAALLPFLAES